MMGLPLLIAIGQRDVTPTGGRLGPVKPDQGAMNMVGLPGLDWSSYFRSLQDGDLRDLALWLAATGLELGEFMEIVDRAYAAGPPQWRGRPGPFVARLGRPIAEIYAQRKRRFAELVAALEDARMSGALPGEVAPRELQPIPSLRFGSRRNAEDLLAALEHARRGL